MVTSRLRYSHEERAHADSKRDEIVRAAIRLFARQGIDGTTIREIGREAGVTQAALYKHFPSKEAVALSVFLHYGILVLRLVDSHAERTGPFPERLDALVAALIQLHDEDPFSFLLLEQQYRIVTGLRTGIGNVRTPLQALQEFLEQGVAAGQVRPGNMLIRAALCLGAVQRLSAFSDTGSLPATLQPFLSEIQQAARNLVGLLP